jgi:hypothetical protein
MASSGDTLSAEGPLAQCVALDNSPEDPDEFKSMAKKVESSGCLVGTSRWAAAGRGAAHARWNSGLGSMDRR